LGLVVAEVLEDSRGTTPTAHRQGAGLVGRVGEFILGTTYILEIKVQFLIPLDLEDLVGLHLLMPKFQQQQKPISRLTVRLGQLGGRLHLDH
jgi:hypothetical protein